MAMPVGAGSAFASYRDAETRKAMVEYVAQKHGLSMVEALNVRDAERMLLGMDHIALAYLRIEMEEAAQ